MIRIKNNSSIALPPSIITEHFSEAEDGFLMGHSPQITKKYMQQTTWVRFFENLCQRVFNFTPDTVFIRFNENAAFSLQLLARYKTGTVLFRVINSIVSWSPVELVSAF